MHKFLSFFILLAFMTNCSPVYVSTGPELDIEEITWLVQKTAVKFRHECLLRHEHSSVLFDENGFARIGFQFSTQSILDVEHARALLVDFVEYLLGEVNRDPLLAGQLVQYPFTADNLDIVILCESYYTEYVDPLYIGCIKLKHGISYFYAADEKDQTLYSWHSRVEPYGHSRRFVMLERAAEADYEASTKPPRRTIPDQFLP